MLAILALGRQRQADPWDFLASQSKPVSARPVRDPVSKDKAICGMKLTSDLHAHVHTQSCSFLHVCICRYMKGTPHTPPERARVNYKPRQPSPESTRQNSAHQHCRFTQKPRIAGSTGRGGGASRWPASRLSSCTGGAEAGGS